MTNATYYPATNGIWSPALGSSSWISYNALTGLGYQGDDPGTTYDYATTFTLSVQPGGFTGPAEITMNAGIYFDNYVTNITLYDTTTSTYLPVSWTSSAPTYPDERGYYYEVTADTPATDFISPNTFILTVSGINIYVGADFPG